jgi:voltage-gated potassium channel
LEEQRLLGPEIFMIAPSRLPTAITALRGKYSILLITFLVFFLVGPLADLSFAGEHSGGELFDLLSIVLLLAALYAVSAVRGPLIIASILTIPVMVGKFASYGGNNSVLFEISDGFSFLALAVIAVSVLRQILKAEKVSREVVEGAVCVYILLGAAWAFLFSFIETLHPGSFQLPPLRTISVLPVVAEARQRFVYYSFVTLTTVGYGDITPVAALAQRLAVLEAMFGQLYLSILVARLVGLHIAHTIQS